MTRVRLWRAFVFLKVFYMLFGVFIYSRFTRLGDSDRYLDASLSFSPKIFYSSTSLLDFIGSILGTVPFLGHFFACFISIYGISYLLKNIPLSYGMYIVVVLFMSLPTFGIWSSIYGKEAFTVFSLSVTLAYIVKFNYNQCGTPRPIELLAIYLLLLLKPQYFIALANLLTLSILWRANLHLVIKWIISCLIIFIGILLLYAFRDLIDHLSFVMITHFSTDANSTRDASFIWDSQYDVFKNAFYGMFIAFIGPTFEEGMNKPLQLIAFFESVLLIFILIGYFIKDLLLGFSKCKVNLASIFIILCFMTWLLFVHYPFGVLNPGSALRYRSGFLHVLIIVVVYYGFANQRRVKNLFFRSE
ncbi:hypothetical protein HWQ46_19520 [Shewanella sp. D64]|uniref:hypothetical protein n=1 Tax=unclassified Shewanella TaxID=196818 RepID=UPI0022BA2878|nr:MULTISPECIES: hypothetical protein [unclassified Shewanella]MEC4727739.1 hypothetical protein [Shewanella sp. D64]MEC4737502.1 hypothetical protein [Shewanella sp. E94]WBJ97312.1 hypothetical protein HWQ47_09545 [Shewanella sp. MTB7]